MNNEALTEKVSVNVNTATLSEIDLLVDGGYYSNRSDFINHALRSSLQEERATVERLIEQKKCPEVPDRTWFLGISNLSAEELRQAREAGRLGDVRRIVLLNTDWTSAGNVKCVTVHDGASAFDAEVREGRMRHLLVSGSVAVGFEVPSAVVDGLKADDRGVSFAVQGCGPVEITVDSPKPLGALGLEGCKGSLNGARLRLDMGAAWSRAQVAIPFANGDRPAQQR
mgnify:CR=1 FL=1